MLSAVLSALLFVAALQQAAPISAGDPAAAASAVSAAEPELRNDAEEAGGTCEYPSWRQRPRCAIDDALAMEAEAVRTDVACEEAMTQVAMNLCSAVNMAWERARMEVHLEAATRSAFDAARNELDLAANGGPAHPYGSQFLVDLRESQKQWETYVDRVCGSFGAEFLGGSIQPMMVEECHGDLTRQRTLVLWRYSLSGLEGGSEWPAPNAPVSPAEIETMKAGRTNPAS